MENYVDQALHNFSDYEPFRHFPLWHHVPDVVIPEWVDDDLLWDLKAESFHLKAESILKEIGCDLPDVSYDDIVVGVGGEYVSPQLLGTLGDASCGRPKLVIRLKRDSVSLMRFLDAVCHNLDFLGLLESVPKYDKKLKGQKILLESGVIDQARASMSFRYAARRCGDSMAIHNYSALSEIPLDQIERRYQVLADLHADYVSGDYRKIVKNASPRLPHFLEISYQRFLSARSQGSSFKHGQTVLNLLGKSLLYFMLEDLSASGMDGPVSKGIRKELLGGKPVSDGRLFDLQKKLIKSVKDADREPLVTELLFKSLPRMINDRFVPMVQARNRAHHAPYDVEGFIDEMRSHLPAVIDELRRLFSNLELLVPLHYKTDAEGDYVVVAKSLTGHQFEYPDLDFVTGLEPSATPCGALMLCRVAPTQSPPPESHVKTGSDATVRGGGEQSPPVEDKGHESPVAMKSVSPAIDAKAKEWIKLLHEAAVLRDKMDKAYHRAVSPQIIGAVPLECFFSKKNGYKEMLMTGIFDRVVKGTPEFEYIEE